MDSRSTLALSVVVVVVLLAGCSGLLGDGGGTDDPEEFAYADGFSAEGVTDGDQAIESHEQALKDRGNYTGTYRYDILSGGNETVVEVDYRVDFQEERGYQRFHAEGNGSAGTRELYYQDGRRYQRTLVDDEQVQASANDQPFPADDLTADEAIQPLLNNASDYETSVDRRHGTDVVVYETTDIGEASDLYSVEDPENVSDFSAQFAVDSTGLVHTAEYEITYVTDGEEQTLSMSFELSQLGETTVERPEWTNDL
jgi:hypothetical protein